jgi:hypothetical protein
VPWSQVMSACAFLLVMAALLIVRVWLPPTFSGVDPERRFAMRYQAAQDRNKNENESINNGVNGNSANGNGAFIKSNEASW